MWHVWGHHLVGEEQNHAWLDWLPFLCDRSAHTEGQDIFDSEWCRELEAESKKPGFRSTMGTKHLENVQLRPLHSPKTPHLMPLGFATVTEEGSIDLGNQGKPTGRGEDGIT